MATVEDVLELYVREPTKIYHDCQKKNNIENCPNCWKGVCYCFSEEPIKTITIGNNEVPCNIKRKCYIKPGEECPICMESITNKSNAYLTCCGHSFHKKCIFKSMETFWQHNYAKNFKCPMCRTNLGMDIHAINERYTINDNSGYLDELENFWFKKDFRMAHTCRNNYDHYLGMKKDCSHCRKYVLNGDFE